MKILYVFPHPDDESFGPAPGMHQQLRHGHEVYLLTLTRGGATKVRHELGLSVQEMGEVRLKEMECVMEALGLSGMAVLDLPDSGLKECNPIELESVIREHVEQIRPDVLVTYAVHGVSGFHDHLVTHAVVKRVYCELIQERTGYLKRLALFTLGPDFPRKGPFNLQSSEMNEIDCILEIADEDSQMGKRALECYKTYQHVIEKTGVAETTDHNIHFEFFMEQFDPPLHSLTDQLGAL